MEILQAECNANKPKYESITLKLSGDELEWLFTAAGASRHKDRNQVAKQHLGRKLNLSPSEALSKYVELGKIAVGEKFSHYM